MYGCEYSIEAPQQDLSFESLNMDFNEFMPSVPLANSVDPDQMLQNMTSNQGLHCKSLMQQFVRHMNR